MPNIDHPNTKENWKSTEEILGLTPQEMVDYLSNLEKNGELADFMKNALNDDRLVAQFSYWEKWMKTKQRKLFEGIIARKKEIYPGEKTGLPLQLDRKFSEEELKIIFSNLGAIQLTFGCSKGCPFCGFDAIPGVREYTPYSQLANLFQKYGPEIGRSKPFLYYASEPSDYKFEDKTYEDAHELAERYAGYSPHITSKENNSEKWLAFMNKKSGENKISDPFGKVYSARVSVFGAERDIIDDIRAKYKEIEIVGQGEEHTVGMGISSKREDKKTSAGIGCFDGALLTPRGLYNIIQTEITKKHPQGFIIVPFEGFKNEVIDDGKSLEEISAHYLVKHKNQHSNSRHFFEIDCITFIDKNGQERSLLFNKNYIVISEFKSKNAIYIKEKEEELRKAQEQLEEINKKYAKYAQKMIKLCNDYFKFLFIKLTGKPHTREQGYGIFGCYLDGIRFVLSEDSKTVRISNQQTNIEIPVPQNISQKIIDYNEKTKLEEKEHEETMEMASKDIMEIFAGELEEYIKNSKVKVQRKVLNKKNGYENLNKNNPIFSLLKRNGDIYIIHTELESIDFKYPGTDIDIDIPIAWGRRLTDQELEKLNIDKNGVQEETKDRGFSRNKGVLSLNQVMGVIEEDADFEILLDRYIGSIR